MTDQSHSISRGVRHARKLLLLLWLCFLARALFYCAVFPLWEGYDEPSHFAFVQFEAWQPGLPVASTPVSREVAASLHLLPLSWEQRLHVIAPPTYTEDSYWNLPSEEREAMQKQVHALPREWQKEPATAPAMYEAQQAPLYYWLMAFPTRLAWQWSLPARVMLVRVLSALLVSLVVPIAYEAAVLVLGSRAQALGIVAVITCMPELMIDMCRVGNDSLSLVLFSLLTLLLLLAVGDHGSKWFLPAGVVLGLGLLSKAYFLTAIPVFLILAIFLACRELRQRRIRVAVKVLAGMGLAAAISFAWYWRTYALTHSLSGEQDEAMAANAGLLHKLAAVVHVKWIGGVTSILVSHIWFGGWSFLKLPKPFYLLFACGMGLALVGVIKLVCHDRLRSVHLLVLTSLYGFFWLGLLYNILVIYLATGVSASCGWYMYAVVVPELLLVILGLFAIAPKSVHWAVLPAMAAAFAVIDLYGIYFLALPYYTGLLAHQPGTDIVHPMPWNQLSSANFGIMLQRLTLNKPALLGQGLMAILAFLYSAGTILSAGIAFCAARTSSARRAES
jgi:4-amino-4-deoxy-L-arabinose transferase-like glycosyltransferase